MRVLTIIASYNFEPWLDLCLGSLRNSELTTSVIVIDNLSKDNTVTRIKKEYPEVILIQNSENKGFGQANNIGLSYALKNDYDYVFLLNQDAYINPDTLSKLINQAEKNKAFGIISPVHLNGKKDELDFGFKTYTNLNNLQDLKNNDQLIESTFINAALWLIPSFVLKKIGGFAPLFPHYGEDVDYVNRVKYAGLKIGYVQNSFGFHCRENRKATQTQFLNAEYLYFLTEAVNPNYSKVRAFAYSVLASLKKAIECTIKLNLKMAFQYILITKKLLYQTCSIRETRNLSMNKESAFLL